MHAIRCQRKSEHAGLTRSVSLCRALPSQGTDDHGLGKPSCSRMPASGTGHLAADRYQWPRSFCRPWRPLRLHCIRRSVNQSVASDELTGLNSATLSAAVAVPHRHLSIKASSRPAGETLGKPLQQTQMRTSSVDAVCFRPWLPLKPKPVAEAVTGQNLDEEAAYTEPQGASRLK